MDTAAVPEELKPYLSLYLEVLFESPVLRDGGMRKYLLFLSLKEHGPGWNIVFLWLWPGAYFMLT